MKKTLIALAALAATGAVMAQSSVTIYGVIDQAVTRTSNSGGTSNTELRNGGNVTNRLGFRGTEDLGGGLKAKFQIETTLAADAPSATSLGDRGAWVGLAGDAWGEVRLGREYNNAFWNPIVFSPWGTNGVGQSVIHTTRNAVLGSTATTTMAAGAPIANQSNYIWNNNAISYVLPGNLGGVYGGIQHALDEQPAAGNNSGRSTNLRLGYKAAGFDVAFGYGKTDGVNATNSDVTSTNLGASYDFGVAKVMAAWAQDKLETASTGATAGKLTGYEIGVVAPVGPGNLRASYGQAKLDVPAVTADPKVSKFAIGYVYPMSKRTSLYTSYARTSNKNGAQVSTIGAATAAPATAAVPGRSASGIDFGISHSF